MISAVVSGILGTDATLKTIGDNQVLEFRIASRRYDPHSKGSATDWVQVSMWGGRSAKLQQYLTKGSRACVRGQLSVRTYQHNGVERFEISCKADDIELMNGRPEAQAQPTTNGHAVPADEIPF